MEITQTQELTIAIPNTQVFGSTVQGEWLPVDVNKIHNTWLVRLLAKGIQRQVNDNAKGESPQQKLEVGRLLAAEIMNGQPAPLAKTRVSAVDPVTKKARNLAHVAIKDWLAANGKDVKGEYSGKKVAEQVAMRDKWIAQFPALLDTAKDLLAIEANAADAAKAETSADLADIFG